MSTLADIRASVAAKGYDVDTATLDDAINQSYREVCAARRWPFLAFVQDIPLVAQDDQLLVTADISSITMHIDAVRLTDGTPLEWQPWDHFSELEATSGTPKVWTRVNNVVYVWPKPDANITLRLLTTFAPANMTSPTSVAAVPTEYADAITWGAVAILAFRQRDYAGADRAQLRRDDAVNRMIRAYGIEQRQGGRTVRETGIWD